MGRAEKTAEGGVGRVEMKTAEKVEAQKVAKEKKETGIIALMNNNKKLHN